MSLPPYGQVGELSLAEMSDGGRDVFVGNAAGSDGK